MRRAIFAAVLAVLLGSAAAAQAGSTQTGALARLIAPGTSCPHQTDSDTPIGVQVTAMRCMTNFARERSSIGPLAEVPALDRAAAHKSADILRCDEFSHEACGRQFTFWMQRFGYLDGGCASAGENIAWGTGQLGSVRNTFKAWIRSAGHRENILRPSFADLGVALQLGTLAGHRHAHVWTQEFGRQAC